MMVLGVIKMSRKAVDTEYLSDVWTRINSVISEQEIQKYKLAKQCGLTENFCPAIQISL